MRILIIAAALFIALSPCRAEEAQRSFVYTLDGYVFRIPTPAFFKQLKTQFCVPIVDSIPRARCVDNLGILENFWYYFHTYLQVLDDKSRLNPMGYRDIGKMLKEYDRLNDQVIKFVETQGADIFVKEEF